jgi:hypothetical protein
MRHDGRRQAENPLIPMSSFARPPLMIRARQACFCGEFRAATMASSRALSKAVTEMLIPVRIPHCRTPQQRGESQTGLVRSDQSTSPFLSRCYQPSSGPFYCRFSQKFRIYQSYMMLRILPENSSLEKLL